MRYYNCYMLKAMQGSKKDAILQKYFPDNNKWGCSCLVFYGEDKDLIYEINTLSDVTQSGATWTHYCNIQNCGEKGYEVNRQFMGKEENEMHIFGYFKRFGDAVRAVANEEFFKRKYTIYK